MEWSWQQPDWPNFSFADASIAAMEAEFLRRMFREGPSGFKGGLTAANYIRITKTSPATARRDLVGLVELGALARSGEKKGTRYDLELKGREIN